MQTRIICLAVLGMALAGPLAARAQQCDDFSACTTNDMCDGEGNCSGTPAAGGNCDDQNDCTINDRCQPDGSCSGTLANGTECDDFNECSTNDRCMLLGEESICLGSPGTAGTPCAGGCGTCTAIVPIPGTPLLCQGDVGNNGDECTPTVELGNCFTGSCTITPQFALCLPAERVCPDTDGDKCTDNCNQETGQCQKNAPKCFPGCETCNGSTSARRRTSAPVATTSTRAAPAAVARSWTSAAA